MTPKQKAAELIQRYSFGRYDRMTADEKQHTKNICMLVADELSDAVVSDILVHSLSDEKSTEIIQYYYDVLNEIIKY